MEKSLGFYYSSLLGEALTVLELLSPGREAEDQGVLCGLFALCLSSPFKKFLLLLFLRGIYNPRKLLAVLFQVFL